MAENEKKGRGTVISCENRRSGAEIPTALLSGG